MAAGKIRSKKDGQRKNKKAQASRQDQAARKAGVEGARPRVKGSQGGVPKAAKAGRQKRAGAGTGSPTHKDFSAAGLAGGGLDRKTKRRGRTTTK